MKHLKQKDTNVLFPWTCSVYIETLLSPLSSDVHVNRSFICSEHDAYENVKVMLSFPIN